MKKILFIGDNWFGDLGGRKKIVLALMNFLINDYNIYLLTIDTKIKKESIKDFKKDLEEDINIYPYFFPRNVFFYFKLLILFGIKILKIRPNLIISFGGGPHSNANFFYISKIFAPKSKIIFIEQGNTRHLFNKQNLIVKLLTKIAFKSVDKIITAGEGVAEDVKNLFNLRNNQVTFVYNFVDFEKIKNLSLEAIEEKIFADKFKPIILAVNRLDLYQKDILTLLNAFSVVAQNVDAYLVIIGEGPDRVKVENKIKELNLESKVFLLGHKNNPYKYMKNSDVFVLSSFHEGMPIVLIEAMVCNLPVVATDCDFGPREIIKDGHNGFLVKVGDYETMAKKIIELIKHKELIRKFVENSFSILPYFSSNYALEKYKEIINSVMTQ
ncbi:MAG: glycosyl transferase [Candidatus Parcubacteria bacterium]|nr:MAG: glycosyl transferase [Candidatus Parcubacteria bacterium]